MGYKAVLPSASMSLTALPASSKSPGSERGGGGESFAYKTVEASVTDASHKGEEHCSLTGLKKQTRYQIMVQAFNSRGAGPPSDHAEAETLQFGKYGMGSAGVTCHPTCLITLATVDSRC